MANILIETSAALRSTTPLPHPQNVARQASRTGEMINLINDVHSDRSTEQSAGYDRFYYSKHNSKRRNQPMTSLKDINPWFANMVKILESNQEETEAEYYKRLADTVRYHVIENPEVLEEYEKNLNKKKKKDIRRPSYETSVSSEYEISSEEMNDNGRKYLIDLQLADSRAETMETNNNSIELLDDQVDDKTLDGVQEEATFRPSFPDDDDEKPNSGDIDLNVQEKEKNEPIKDDKKQYCDPPKIEKISIEFKTHRPWNKDEPQVDEEKAHTNDFSANGPKKDEDRYNSREDYQKKRNIWEKKSSQWSKNGDTYTKKEKRNEGDDYNKGKRPITSDHKGVERLIDDNWNKDPHYKEDSGKLKDKDNINDTEKKNKQLDSDVDSDEGSEEQRKQETKGKVSREKKKRNRDHGISNEWDKNNVDNEKSNKDKDWNKKDDCIQENHDWDKKDGRNKKDDDWNKKDNRNKEDGDQNKNNNSWNKNDSRNKKHNDWHKKQRNDYVDRNKNNDDWDRKEDAWDKRVSDKNKKEDWNKKDKKSDSRGDGYKKKQPEPPNNDWDKVGIDTTQKQERGQYEINKEKIEDVSKVKKKNDDYKNHIGDRREMRRRKNSATTAVKYVSKMVENYKPKKNKT